MDDLQHRLGQAEDKIDKLSHRMAEPTREREATATRHKRRDTRKLLPYYDYTLWWAFARLHGIPESTVAIAIKEQTLSAERGNWKSGGRTVTEAFDDYERELFYDHFHNPPQI